MGGIRWSVQTDGPVRSSPTVVDDTVYVGSDDGGLYAVDAITGDVLWRYEAGQPVRSGPAVEGRLVYVTAGDRHLVAVDRFDGAMRWQAVAGPLVPFEWGLEGWDYYTSSPAVSEGRVVAGFGDGTVRAFEARTGVELWRHATGGRVRASPAIADGTVYIGSADGRVYAIELASGQVRWTFATRGVALRAADEGFDRRTVQGSVTVHGDTLFVGSRDARLYALDRLTGTELWSSEDGSAWVIATPAVADGVVYSVRSSSGRLRALRAASGELLFDRTFPGALFASPVAVGGAVYLASEAGEIVAVDASGGADLWRVRLGAAVWSSPAVLDGMLYVGSDDGALYALEGTDGPVPRRAVFWTEALRQRSMLGRHDGHREIVEHLAARGFETLDDAALEDFLRDRIEDGAPSVIVMAMDALPATVAADEHPTGLLARYLEAGGKVVWPGSPPFFLQRDPESGTVTADRARSSRFTGVDHSAFNSDEHPLRTTVAGRAWGLEGWWMGPSGVDPRSVTTVLATDETGAAGAWVRSYGGPPGTGFVHLPVAASPASRGRIPAGALERIRAVAEYGVFRRR